MHFGEQGLVALLLIMAMAESKLERWRLLCEGGRQTWRYLSEEELEHDPGQTFAEKYFLGLSEPCNDRSECSSVSEASSKAMLFYQQLQSEDGHWAGDYGGPLFLMCGAVIVSYISGCGLDERQKYEMVRYLRSVQRSDGGWGMHAAGKSTVFGTAMNYVTFRLLGVGADDSDASRARACLHQLGGAIGIPSWGKFWLAVLNVYSWDGMHSLMPEIWLLPSWFPAHPSTLWCHCRQVYLPMAYCYGARVTAEEDSLILQLRKELYITDYSQIKWSSERSNIASCDLYTPHSWLLCGVHCVFNTYEYVHSSAIRKMALDKCYEHIMFDDDVTDGISIGPISKVIQMLARWHREGPFSEGFLMHARRMTDYMWLGADGMRMNGTNGSQLWDTTFVVQAFIEGGAGDRHEFADCLQKAYEFFNFTQIKKNPAQYEVYFRHPNKGGFPFSTFDCGWIVADCTAEGLKSLLMMREKCSQLSGNFVPMSRIHDAVDCLLTYRNADGGIASYETKRGGLLLELLNPSEVFGDIMIDYTYVECTSAVVQALHYFQEVGGSYRKDEVKAVIQHGIAYIRNEQRYDGSWEGSWGVCFTYAAWFAMEALMLDGESYEESTSGSVPKGCEFLLSKQNADGGWGEDFASCETRHYVASSSSSIVNTAWALLALMAAKFTNVDVLRRGVCLIMSRQLANGDWPEEDIKGVFNKTCAIQYTSYKNVFPIWALGRFHRLYPDVSV